MSESIGDEAKRERLLERVRALLAMTTENGCTEAEAMTAAALAAKIMEEFDLALDEVEEFEEDDFFFEFGEYPSSAVSKQVHIGALMVSGLVGHFFDCKHFRIGNAIAFFGLKHDVSLAHGMLKMIRAAMDRELADYLKALPAAPPKSARSSFLKGMANRISERLFMLKEMRRTAFAAARGSALVTHKLTEIEKAWAEVQKEWGLTKDTTGTAAPRDRKAYGAGVVAGQRYDLGEPELLEDVEADPVAATRSPLDVKPARIVPRWMSNGVETLHALCTSVVIFSIPLIGVDVGKVDPLGDNLRIACLLLAGPGIFLSALQISFSAELSRRRWQDVTRLYLWTGLMAFSATIGPVCAEAWGARDPLVREAGWRMVLDPTILALTLAQWLIWTELGLGALHAMTSASNRDRRGTIRDGIERPGYPRGTAPGTGVSVRQFS